MSRARSVVIEKTRPTEQLPAWAGEGAVLLTVLDQQGTLAEIAARLRIRRQGGYCGLDVFVLLFWYFTSRLGTGIKSFRGRLQRAGSRLAAVAGRRALPSAASLSRALSAEVGEDLCAFGAWLLGVAAEGTPLLQHEVTAHHDAHGEAWQVYDYDGTNTVLRHRALPEGEELPSARRRSEGLAAPGYPGRKRGDTQLHRSTLQHAGTGLWLGIWLAPGHGDRLAELRAALAVVRDTSARTGQSLDRVFVRMDGEFGWVPDLTACREEGIIPLTRLNRPEILDMTEARRRLNDGEWCLVPDSGSGPRRGALDLGIVTVPPGKATVRPDGSPYSAVAIRVVVSRYPREGEAEHGRVLGAWQYELFATDLDAAAWPAAEVVAAYFARSGQENRFAQEDRELGLDRIFSYHLPGQWLATLIGLFVWNLRVVQGWCLAAPPPTTPRRVPREAALDERPGDVPPPPEATTTPAPPEETALEAVIRQRQEAEAQLSELLHPLDWDDLLKRQTGWSWDPQHAALRCPQQQLASLTSIKRFANAPHRPRLIFRASLPSCARCPRRADCLTSVSPQVSKMVDVTVNLPLADTIAPILHQLQLLRRKQTSLACAQRSTPSRPGRPPAAGPAFPIQPIDAKPGPYASSGPRFLPARARRRLADAAAELVVSVRLELPPDPPAPHPLLARSEAERQHRRLTWAARLRRNALPDGAQIEVRLAGGEAVRALLQDGGLVREAA